MKRKIKKEQKVVLRLREEEILLTQIGNSRVQYQIALVEEIISISSLIHRREMVNRIHFLTAEKIMKIVTLNLLSSSSAKNLRILVVSGFQSDLQRRQEIQ